MAMDTTLTPMTAAMAKSKYLLTTTPWTNSLLRPYFFQ
jgi:hypothetical protein